MAKVAGVSAAAAGWGHGVRAIEQSMRQQCGAGYFDSVAEFAAFLLE